MKRIALLSGKGGTGKTSIAASFGFLAGNKTVLCDCDVDAANLPIICSKKNMTSEVYSGGQAAIIDPSACSGCGKCAAICRFNAVIKNKNGVYSVIKSACEGCGYCSLVCPEKAIQLEAVNSGEVFLSESRFGSFIVHAELDAGAENSGKLSSRVRLIGDQTAARNGQSVIIIDGPPGVSCPAIAAAAGTDYVLLVAEPSLSGLSDIRRIFELLKKMKIKAGVIVNKADINENLALEMKESARESGAEYLGAIPWSADFVNAVHEAKTVTEYSRDPRIVDVINNSWDHISKKLEDIT